MDKNRKYTSKKVLFKRYSPFHSSLPFEHLGQSSLCVNQVTFYSILELKQCPRCQVFLKSIQHLSSGNDATSSDKNIVIVWLKHILCTTYTMHIKNTYLNQRTNGPVNAHLSLLHIPINTFEYYGI